MDGFILSLISIGVSVVAVVFSLVACMTVDKNGHDYRRGRSGDEEKRRNRP